jgi:hypothetical protein
MNNFEYKLRFYTFFNHDLEIVFNVLSTTPLKEIVFPAKMYNWFDDPKTSLYEIDINEPDDFAIENIPEALIEENVMKVYIDPLNQTKLSFCINRKISILQNNLILEFNKKHIDDEVIDRKKIISIISNNIDLFKIRKAEVVYQESNIKWVLNLSTYDKASIYVDWITYLGKEICDFIGRDHLLSLDGCAEIREIGGGILLVFQEEPFDPENSAHIKHRDYILEQLNAIPLPPPEV